MNVINVLDSKSANMIAAGEVVDKPASAVKELVENAIDAGATTVSVEIRNGGTAFIRVTDDGVGMTRSEVPKSILRHATSKIRSGSDLDGIKTLGFRGEALAAIAAVSELQIVTRTAEEEFGSLLESDGEGVTLQEVGCPVGTTVVIRNLFYNTPARRKFMKRDSTEAASCRAVVEKEALSHPKIKFKFTVDGELRLSTPGNGKVYDTIAEIYGTTLAKNLIPVECENENALVRGYICQPSFAKGRNNSQNCFVNGRYVVSKTAQAATKAAFLTYMPSDRYPVTFLYINVSPDTVDVNVHPAKTEIKFSQEHSVYEAVYFAVRGALNRADAFTEKPEELYVNAPTADFNAPETAAAVSDDDDRIPTDTQEYINGDHSKGIAPFVKPEVPPAFQKRVDVDEPTEGGLDRFALVNFMGMNVAEDPNRYFADGSADESEFFVPKIEDFPTEPRPQIDTGTQTVMTDEPEYRYVGELYNSFIIAETKTQVYIIDKHAAHERILYEKFKKSSRIYSQILLIPKKILLDAQTLDIIHENRDFLDTVGFGLSNFTNGTLLVTAVPSAMETPEDTESLLESYAEQFYLGSNLPMDQRQDKALFTMACKAAVKAGIPNDSAHNKWILDNLFEKKTIKYCPHGRPVAKAFEKKEVAAWFDR